MLCIICFWAIWIDVMGWSEEVEGGEVFASIFSCDSLEGLEGLQLVIPPSKSNFEKGFSSYFYSCWVKSA